MQPIIPLTLSKLLPNQSSEQVIPLNTDGIYQASVEIHLLQFAIKNNTGFYYFHAKIPLLVLFTEEAGLVPQEWVAIWRENIPQSNEFTTVIPLLRPVSISIYKERLLAKNIKLIAEKTVETQVSIDLYRLFGMGIPRCKIEISF